MKSISLEPAGSSEAPRWVIARTDGHFWSGCEWTATKNEAALYANLFIAATDCDEILRKQFCNKPHVQHFTVPINIEVLGDVAADIVELEKWLRKAATLYVDCKKHGNGPGSDLAILSVNWGGIK
jgi:hypothetical protein